MKSKNDTGLNGSFIILKDLMTRFGQVLEDHEAKLITRQTAEATRLEMVRNANTRLQEEVLSLRDRISKMRPVPKDNCPRCGGRRELKERQEAHVKKIKELGRETRSRVQGPCGSQPHCHGCRMPCIAHSSGHCVGCARLSVPRESERTRCLGCSALWDPAGGFWVTPCMCHWDPVGRFWVTPCMCHFH